MTTKIIKFESQKTKTAYTISPVQNFEADYLEVIAPAGNKRWLMPKDKRHADLFQLIRNDVKEYGKSCLVLFW